MKKLANEKIWEYDLLERDKAGRWYTTERTPKVVADYVGNYRTPSRHWPLSYFRALTTMKAAKYIATADPELAKNLEIL